MVRWYDYIAALMFAEVLLLAAFTVPVVGVAVAYASYEVLWGAYCLWRKHIEH